MFWYFVNICVDNRFIGMCLNKYHKYFSLILQFVSDERDKCHNLQMFYVTNQTS